MKTKQLLTALPLLMLFSGLATAAPLGMAFTYQGQLTERGAPANGVYDLRLALYDAATNGAQWFQVVTNVATPVANGIFTATLDFGGGVFDGNARWLEIGVRTNGSPGDFTLLSPRQPLAPTPYALFATNAGLAVNATTALGVATNAVTVAGIANSNVTAAKIAGGQVVKSLNQLKDDVLLGAGTNITMAVNGNLITLSSPTWSLTGNSGTTPGTHFLGTTDNQPLELRVNNTLALRLEPTGSNDTVNVIEGSPRNYVGAGVVGATIGGGGSGNYYGTAFTNAVLSDFGTIGGGCANTIQTNADYATLGGGALNAIQTDADYATLGGGSWNTIQTSAYHATLGGGYGNAIQPYAVYATLGGGALNTIQTDADYATLGGGYWNTIQTDADYATLGGGYWNTIQSGAHYATIPGGQHNSATNYAFAAGRRAKANHTGTFVWADSTDADFTSTANNQFLIRATGGVGINTASPQQALHVVGDALVQGTNFTASGHSARLLLGDENHYIRGVYGGGMRIGTFGATDGIMLQETTGNVGIGTTAPNQKLEVNGRIRMDTWTADGTTAVYKNASGDIGLQSSDQRLKKNIESIGNALDIVAGLRGVTFNWLNQPDHAPKTVGLIAQEVRTAMPELTFEFQGDDGLTYYGVHYEKVAAVLVNAVQQQQGRLQAQQSEIGALKERLAKLECLLTQARNGATP